MADRIIMLAKPFNPSKLVYPVDVTFKLDGVAADFYKTLDGWKVQSAQGKPLPSAERIVWVLNTVHYDQPVGSHLVGELTVMGVPDFKTAGGIIRRQQMDKRVVLNVYDYYMEGRDQAFDQRINKAKELVNGLGKNQWVYEAGGLSWSTITMVPHAAKVYSAEELSKHIKSLSKVVYDTKAGYEGLVLRSLRGPDSVYKPSKRSWGMQKLKPKPTLDLQVVSFEEATANEKYDTDENGNKIPRLTRFLGEDFKGGEGMRAVGRINVLYKGEIIGAGPGCLTHEERRELWELYTKMQERGERLEDKNLIAEVEYMLDSTYSALRQAVFKRWRTDKNEPNEEDT